MRFIDMRAAAFTVSFALVALLSAAPAWAGTEVTVRMMGESAPGSSSGGLKVELLPLGPGGRPYSEEISKETGRAVFPDVEPGRYEIRVTPQHGGSNNSRYGSNYSEIPAEGRAEYEFHYWGLPITDTAGDGIAGKRQALRGYESDLHEYAGGDLPEDESGYEKAERRLRKVKSVNEFGESRLNAMIPEVLDDMRPSTRDRAERALAEEGEQGLRSLASDLYAAVNQVLDAKLRQSDEVLEISPEGATQLSRALDQLRENKDLRISPEVATDIDAVIELIMILRRRDMHRTLRMEAEEALRNAPAKDGGAKTDETSQIPAVPGDEAQPVGYSGAFDIAPGSAFSLSFDAGYGQIDRGGIQLPIRVEEGGLFQEAIGIDPGWNDAFSASGRIELGLGTLYPYRPEVLARKRLGLSFDYFGSDASGSIGFIEGGDANPFIDGSALLDPGGLGGGIGGGGIKLEDNGNGFADHRDVRADSEYQAYRVGLDVSNSYGFGDVLIRPRTGVYYGHTDEDVGITGTTGNGLVDYRYWNDLGSDRLGAEFSLETRYQVTEAFRVTVTPRIALSQVWANGESALDVDVGDVPFASSSASGINETFTSFEYSISGGVEFDLSNNATLTLEGSWGSGENPALEFEPEERANIASQRYQVWAITGGIQINF